MKTQSFLSAVLCSLIVTSPFTLSSCASTTTHESTGQYIDSSALTMKVKAKLLEDKSVKSLPITVNTYQNVVQLSGFVDNREQRDRAVLIAKSVKGVAGVRNDLVVK